MNKVNSLSIIDNTDIDSFKNTMNKIEQFQRLVKENLKEGKDYGTIPGTQKPTLYKAGAEKIVILGKLRSTFDVLDETKDYEKEFFQFEIRWNLWAGDNLLVQGVGLCNSKEDKYRYRWVGENKLPNNIKKDNLLWKEINGKYGKYKAYRIENEDICTLANTILKMAKKRSLVDAALLVGSLSDLFTQDMEDLQKEYIENEKPIQDTKNNDGDGSLKPTNNDLATIPQINLIKTQIVGSHLFKPDTIKDKSILDLLESGMTKAKASEIISWWKGDSKKFVVGERLKRETIEKETKPAKKGKLEIKDKDAPFPVEDGVLTAEEMPD